MTPDAVAEASSSNRYGKTASAEALQALLEKAQKKGKLKEAASYLMRISAEGQPMSDGKTIDRAFLVVAFAAFPNLAGEAFA